MIAAVPVALTTTSAPKPLGHWLLTRYAAEQLLPPPVDGLVEGDALAEGDVLVDGDTDGEEVGEPVAPDSCAVSGGYHLSEIFWSPVALGCTPS